MRYTGGMCYVVVALFVSSCWEESTVIAFVPTRNPSFRTTGLFMGRGFNSARNKQAELAKKMKLAKKQRDTKGEATAPEDADQEEEEDVLRQEFASLLAKNLPPKDEVEATAPERTTASPPKENKGKPKVTARGLKKRKKLLSEGTKAEKQKIDMEEELENVVLGEGDVAQRRHFEPLLSLETSQPLGSIGAAQLVPWVPPYLTDYLVVVADPRRQSGDLRQSIQYLTSNLSAEILPQVIAVTADSKEETAKWMKRAGIDTPIRMFSDTKLEWMRTYSAIVDDDRWSMSIFVFCTNGVIQKLLHGVDPTMASQVVTDVVQSIEE